MQFSLFYFSDLPYSLFYSLFIHREVYLYIFSHKQHAKAIRQCPDPWCIHGALGTNYAVLHELEAYNWSHLKIKSISISCGPRLINVQFF